MLFKNSLCGFRSLLTVGLVLIVFSCGRQGSRYSSGSVLTGWNFNDKEQGNFRIDKNYKGEKTPPGMVLVEGGTFTMGSVQDDVIGDWNTAPKKVQVRSFYMDEAEVSNAEYLFYLKWLERVFPTSDENYRNIVASALPDTLVWRNVLGNNDLLKDVYLRHPAYANYPVVGVSWLQANAYCIWRTDRINERILVEEGVLNDLFKQEQGEQEAEGKKAEVRGVNHFNTALYYRNPKNLFGGDTTIYNAQGLEKREGRHVQLEEGIMASQVRLPTEAEWEYAAKSLVGNREFNTLKGRKKYPWSGNYTRSSLRKGNQLANFKQGKGDYSGLAGWSNDQADITNSIRSYEPNPFGLYDMAGNVAEWVFDIYEPRIDNDFNDFNYTRGNLFTRQVSKDGKPVINDDKVVYDTLPNGKLMYRQLPGSIKEEELNLDIINKDLEGELGDKYVYAQPNDINIAGKNDTLLLNPNAITQGYRGYAKEDRDAIKEDYRPRDRVYKGGSWRDREFWLDPAQRRFLPEYMSTDFIGFRCAADRIGNASTRSRRGQTRPRVNR